MVVTMMLALLAVVTPAHATNWGSTACTGSPVTCVSIANNAYHVVNWLGDEDITGIQASHAWARDQQYNPTDMVWYTDGADPLPDVIAQDEPYGNNGLVGWVECPPNNTGTSGSHPSRSCRGQYLRYNETYEGSDFWTETQRRRVTCHELGHTVGLRHTTATDSCMYAGVSSVTTLNNHDRNHINTAW